LKGAALIYEREEERPFSMTQEELKAIRDKFANR
jgi:hypothetical protein